MAVQSTTIKSEGLKSGQAPSWYASSEIITVLVGLEEKPFKIHKDLLSSQSPYCAARLFNQRKKEDDLIIRLTEIQEPLFIVIFDWLYTGTISLSLEKLDTISEAESSAKCIEWLELYRSADKLLMSALQNAMIDHDLSKSFDIENERIPWGFTTASHWHEKNLTSTPYYKLFLNDCVWGMFRDNNSYDDGWLEDKVQRMLAYPQLLADVLLQINCWRMQPWPSATLADRDKYCVLEQEQLNNESIAET